MSLKILVVDDEPDIVEFQKSFLLRRKHQVFTATNTNEAIEVIKKHFGMEGVAETLKQAREALEVKP